LVGEVVLLDCVHETLDLVLVGDLNVLKTSGSVNVNFTVKVSGKDNWGGGAESDDGLRRVDVGAIIVLVEVGDHWAKVVDE
jgi:hypothetical protein